MTESATASAALSDDEAELLGKVLADPRSFFRRTAWLDTVRSGRSLDARRRPIPWFNYPFLRFLEPRLTREMDIFEYGCGNSTLWFQERVRTIRSCEHNRAWFNEMSEKITDNAILTFAAMASDDYVQQAGRSGHRFDVVIIDGRRRVECATYAVRALKDDGVIIWDNSNRDRYREGIDFLKVQGFRQLEFTGLGPIANWETSTSLFYRTENCFSV